MIYFLLIASLIFENCDFEFGIKIGEKGFLIKLSHNIRIQFNINQDLIPFFVIQNQYYMNKLITIALAMSIGTVAQAQQLTSIPAQLDIKKMSNAVLQQAFSKQNSAAQSKTTVIKQRVKAESTIDRSQTTPSKVDSSRYVYSGDNGSTFTQGTIGYNTGFPPFILMNTNLTPLYTPDVSADSMYFWSVDLSQTLALANVITANYTNKKANFYNFDDVVDPTNNTKTFSVYDGNGKIIGYNNLMWNTTTSMLDSSDKRRFAYDGQGRLLRDTTYQYDLGDWNPYILMEYNYNGSGNISKVVIKFYATITWITVGQMDLTYTTDNKIKTFMISQFDGTALVPSQADSMKYTTGIAYPTHHWSSSYDGASTTWTPTSYNYIHSNGQGLADTFINHSWNGASYDPSELYVVNYNTNTNPTQYDYYLYVAGSPVLDKSHKFYYEDYNDLAVGDVAKNNNSLVVFPNPTQNTLTVSLKNNAENATIELFSTLGQSVLSAAFTSSITLDASTLASGNYYVIVRNSKGEILGTEKIIKK